MFIALSTSNNTKNYDIFDRGKREYLSKTKKEICLIVFELILMTLNINHDTIALIRSRVLEALKGGFRNMATITYHEISIIVDGFTAFIATNKESTQSLYVDIVKEYLLNEVRNQVDQSDYESIFSEDKIIDFQQNYRRSLVIRSALKKLKDYFIKQDKLDKRFDFDFAYIGNRDKINKSVISLDDIQNVVLGDKGEFRSLEEKVITQCMSAICYYCIFEQRHIRMLKCNDVLINEKRIRNVRVDDKYDDGLVKWIYIGEEIIRYITAYINYFNVDTYSDELFFRAPEGTEFDNSYQNNLFANYKFKGNGFLTVGGQQLNYSRIYHYLVATKGRGVADILPMVGFSNEQLKNAMKEYNLDYGILYNPNNIVNLLSITEVAENYKKAVELYESNVNIDDDALEEDSEWVTVCNLYSEENDVNMNDVILYDSMSQNNQKDKDIVLSRLVRSTNLAENLKLAYNDCCQLCGTRLMKTRFEAYSEAHHIRPYNRVHKGDDTIGNMVVLCPNCHSQFDNLYYAIHPNTRLVHCVDEDDRFHLAKMEFIGEHELEEKYLAYTWKLFKKM